MNTELILKNKKRLFSPARIRTKMTPEEQEILEAAKNAYDEWIDASAGFEQVSDEMLVDYFTYKLKACESRYIYFVRLAKEKGLSRYI
jgi:hypothetical protein